MVSIHKGLRFPELNIGVIDRLSILDRGRCLFLDWVSLSLILSEFFLSIFQISLGILKLLRNLLLLLFARSKLIF
jgi:hypothetical protein